MPGVMNIESGLYWTLNTTYTDESGNTLSAFELHDRVRTATFDDIVMMKGAELRVDYDPADVDAKDSRNREGVWPSLPKSYDEVYGRPEFYWGQDANSLCKHTVELLSNAPKGRVIDLGCGEGKDIINFAQNGFNLVGVDTSKPGLTKVQQWASQEGPEIETVRTTLYEFRLTEMYDIVYASGTLTYVHLTSVAPGKVRQLQGTHKCRRAECV